MLHPTLRYCRRHWQPTPIDDRAVSTPGSLPPMFLPPDLTASEQQLVATITQQMLDHRAPATDVDEQAVRHEAAQIAAEMIYESRGVAAAAGGPPSPAPDSGYHQRMRRALDRERDLQRLEGDEMDQPPDH
jgi:hypothetical protein